MADRAQAGQHSWEGEMFRLLVENVKDYAIFVLDAEGQVQTWCAGAERLLGYREDELIGESAARFFTPEDIQADVLRQEMQEALVKGRGEDDRWHVRKDGSRFWSSGVMTPLRDEGGTIRGFAKIMRDRTDFRLAEDARNDALAYAENIVETVREPLVVLDTDLRVRTANRSFYSTFHVAKEATEGRLLYDLGNRQWDIPALRKLLEDILSRNTSFNDFEVAHDFEAIGHKAMLLNARRIYRKGNDTELILLAIEDITERWRAEEERRELETRFTSLVKNIKDHAIFTVDPEGRVTSWNVEAERILGYTEAEALGQHFSVIFTPEDRSRGLPEEKMRKALEQGQAEDERWHVRKNGERFWALGIITPTHDASGKHTGFSKILRGMTDRWQLEEQLRQRVGKLAEANRQKEEFLAMLAHELRNPLAPIRNCLQIMRQQDGSGTAVEQVQDMAERQVQHMARLLDDLLDVSRISRGLIDLHTEPVDMTPLVNRTVEAIRPLAEQRRHQLTVSLSPEPLQVAGDPTRLEQVVTNLLNNACKYTDPGGHIRLTVGREGGQVVLRVRDDGTGIAPDMLPNVFDLFVQAERRLDRSQGGVGIGLTLVKRLVELHGGSVEAHSPGLGQGSEFVVRLPAIADYSGGEKERVPGKADSAPHLPRRRVLVVEDNRDAADSLTMLLRLAGQDVQAAYDGPSALAVAQEFQPAVVFLDIGMPGMDGYQVARRLREHPGPENMVLVALTGWSQEADRRHCHEAGIDGHLVKPVEPEVLRQFLAHPKLLP
jgi:PAS domain S-box-containing protein